MQKVLTSLIITTYNWKEALRLSLQRVWGQTRLPDEVIIADDGSGPDTAALIRQAAMTAPVPLVHSWHEDEGFRASRSRNQAIVRARGDYIILLDGDMLPDAAFVEDHLAFAVPGFFLQGSRVLLDKRLSSAFLQGGHTHIPFWRQGIGNKKNMIRCKILARLCLREDSGLSGIRTCNFAFWKADALRVNGFNEAFTNWGREDSEFAVRLMNAGVRRRNICFCALALHLYHAENSRNGLAANDELLQRAIKERSVWCKQGLNQHQAFGK